MKTLQLPLIAAQEVYTTISTARRPATRRDRILAASGSVFAAYDTYTGSADDLVALDPADTTPASAADLEGNYDSGSRATQALKGAIFAHNAGGRCCLCAQAPAATLDHYLPKAEYPEFSILPSNLVPACWRCNHAKRALFVDSDAALFVHSYLDALPTDVRFLYADIDDNDGELIVAFRIAPPDAIGDALAARIHTHFLGLRLADYYLGEAVNEISERRAAIAELLGAGAPADVLRDYLEREARSVATDKGINYWRFVLLDSLARYEPLLRGELM